MKRWKAFLCWLSGHDHEQIVDYDIPKAFQRCRRCGHEFQYDFQSALTRKWIGFCDEAHTCKLCFGWKPREWDRCANEICELNPDGALHFNTDGTMGPRLD